jgi:hypothetical protein
MFGGEEILFNYPIFYCFLFFIRGRQIFEYDSDGEAVNFKIEILFLSNKRS